MRFERFVSALMLVGALCACSDVLEVENPNNPDRQRVLQSAADVESLGGAQFQQIVSANTGGTARVYQQMLTASFENASGLANNGMGPRGGIPRQPIDNNRGNAYQIEHFTDFRLLSSAARTTADVLARSKAEGFSLGVGRTGDEQRLKAWAHFVAGVANGNLSLVYDSAGVARPTDASTDIPELEGYMAVNAYALAQFDSALAYASLSGTTALPAGWLTGPTGPAVSVSRFQEVIRSYRARMRAGVARTPAERADAVDWERVIADATAGIKSDLIVAMNPPSGWDFAWLATGLHYRDANWHQMTYYIIGMADTSRAFEAWLATPRDVREPFLIRTPDLRFPQGATRAEQNADRGGQGAPTGGKYIRNRDPGGDQSGTGWMNSWYDHYRFRAYADAVRAANHPIFTVVENDMLAAEGYIRRGNIPAAAQLIDKSRTTSGLPALTGVVTAAAQPVPGGNGCVPRIPVAPNFATTSCGTILEAMKWEKRMEMAYTTYGGWFFDGRGWGDLPVGTGVHWPVPVQEMDARRLTAYNMGGAGLPGGAGASTYGYGTGDR